MSKKTKGKRGRACDPKVASTLAAINLMQYFKEQEWEVVSFFPNAPCCRHKK